MIRSTIEACATTWQRCGAGGGGTAPIPVTGQAELRVRRASASGGAVHHVATAGTAGAPTKA